MQVLLDDLGSADSMYRNMYESSKNSAGSANEENERYMESLQARINLARVEVEKLALAFGDAFLTEGMIQSIQTFGEFLGLVTKFVDKFGILPALLGATGVSLFLLSSRFRTLTGSIGTSVASLLGFSGAAKASAAASALGASAVRGFSVALKGLLASTGVGLALVGVGIAIEVLLGKMEKQRKIQEDITLENNKTTEAYNQNKDTINELSAEYTELEKAMKTAKPDSKTSERYFEVQNELASLMPTLIKGEDTYGNKLLDNASIIESRIRLTEQRAKAEQALQDVLNAEGDAQKLEDSKALAEDGLKGRQKAIEEFRKEAKEPLPKDISYDEEIKDLQDMEKALSFFNKRKQELIKSGDRDSLKFIEVESTITSLDRLLNAYRGHTSEMKTAQDYISSVATESANKQIDENTQLSDSSKNLAKGILYDATLMSKSVKESDSIASIFEGVDSKEFQGVFKDASKAVTDFTNSSIEDFASQTENMENFAQKLKETMLLNAKDSKGNILSSESDAYKNIEASIDSYIQKLISQEAQVRNVASAQGISIEQARLQNYENGELEEGTEALNDEMQEYIASLKELTSVEEQLAGVSQKQIDEVDDLLYLYRSLSSQTDLTAKQTLMLEDAQSKLLAIYPDLSKYGSLRIEDIENEKMAQEVLLEAIELSKDGKLTAEEEMTLSSAINTKAKIEHKKQEILALAGLALAYQQFARAQAAEAARLQAQMEASNGSIDNESAMQDAEIRGRKFAGFSETLAQSNDEYSSLSDALKQLESDMNGYTNSLGSAAERVKDSEEAQKESNKETKESIYYADKYKSALEEINLALEKHNALQSKYPDYSKEYQDSLKAEAVLLQQKLKLTKDQITATKNQIKSGNIAPKGMVNTSSSSSSSSGAYSGKYANEINKAATTYNIDPYLIAAVIQAESSFNPNAKSSKGARGLMQLMPATAKELGVKDSYNAEQNIMGGVKYLSQQLKTFGGDVEKALAAYNAGAGNVRKYGGIPPFKETQNYIKKIMAEYNSGFANVVSTTAKQLSGWTGTQTGKMGDSRDGGKRKHNGIDIAQPKGTKLEANVGGKVIASGEAKSQGYDSSYGNLVVVQSADGAKHFYAHLEKAVAKIGETIVAGAQLGTVGSTGASSGSHLHYGVQKNGSFVDPTQYVNNAKNTVTTSSSSTSSNGEAAQTAQEIDQAKSDLISLEADALAIQELIEQIKVDLITSKLSAYDKTHDTLQHYMDDEIQKREKLDSVSQRFHDSIKNEIRLNGEQIKNYEKERTYLNSLINSTSISAKMKAELTDKVKALSLAIVDLQINSKNLTFERIQATMRRFAEQIDDVVYAIERSQGVLGTLEDGSAGYTNELKKQIPLLEKQKKLLVEQYESLQRSLILHDLTPEQVKEITEQMEDLGSAIWDVEGSIVSMNKEIVDTGKEVANKAADALIDAYKSYIEEKRDMHEKSLDDEMDAEDERHERVTKNLKDELDEFRKIVQARMDEIDRQESERDYGKDIDGLEEERLKILNKINLLSLDNSLEAKAERAKLAEELAKIEDDISERQHAREVDLRKQNLGDILEDEEERVAKIEELENTKHESEKKRIDELKEYWNQFYTDQLNNEAHFAKLREDIMKGNFANLSTEFQGFMDEMKNTMPSLENTLNNTMVAVGTSIRKNIIEQIQEALNLLNTAQDYAGGTGGGSGGSSGGGSSSSLSNADLKVIGGKFLAEKLIHRESNPVRRQTIGTKGHDLAKAGRSEGSVIPSDIGFDSLVTQYSEADKKRIAEYFANNLPSSVITPYLQEFIKNFAKNLMGSAQGFDTGGMTSSWGSGGKLGVLHEEEMILNKKDTSSYKKLTGVLDSFLKFINPIKTSPIGQPVLANGGSGESPIQINFNVENMNATQKEADSFSARIQNNMRRNRGVK